MKKNIIKKLAQESYTKNDLDRDKIERIAKNLKRQDLKVYIKTLKSIESKRTVNITLPSEDGIREIKEQFNRLYPDKKILISIDPTLLTGVKVVDYDNEYELSLKGQLENSIRTTND